MMTRTCAWRGTSWGFTHCSIHVVLFKQIRCYHVQDPHLNIRLNYWSLFGSCRPPAISGRGEWLSQEETVVTRECPKFSAGLVKKSFFLLLFLLSMLPQMWKVLLSPFNIPSPKVLPLTGNLHVAFTHPTCIVIAINESLLRHRYYVTKDPYVRLTCHPRKLKKGDMVD